MWLLPQFFAKGSDSVSKIVLRFSGCFCLISVHSMLICLPLPQCFCPRGRKLRPWSEKNSDQNSDHPRLCIYWGKEKLRPWSEFLGRENSDHGLSFGCFGGRGRRGGSQCIQSYGLKGPQKPRTYCVNSSLRSYLSPSVFSVRSGPVWRQDLAILSPEGPATTPASYVPTTLGVNEEPPFSRFWLRFSRICVE